MKNRLAIFSVGGIGGGIASQGLPAVVGLTEGLARRFDVDAYLLASPDPDFRPTGYRVASPPAWADGRAFRKVRWAALAARFLASHRRGPYDAVFSFWGYPMGTFAVSLARLVRRPSIVALLGGETASVPSIGYGTLQGGASRRLVLATCARASILSVLSEHQRTTLCRNGLVRGDVQVVPIGVDRSRFKPMPKVRSPPLKLLHVANLTPVKDQGMLIRGVDLLRRELDVRLRVVGVDHMGGQVQDLVARLGIGNIVEFAGGIPHDEIPAQLAWADMIVLTSLSEGQNGSLTEAAMAGVLQVSTPVGHIAEFGEEMAVVVRTGDPRDLAARIMAISTDTVGWERRVGRAREWAESHDLEWTIGRYTELIEKVIAGLPQTKEA